MPRFCAAPLDPLTALWRGAPGVGGGGVVGVAVVVRVVVVGVMLHGIRFELANGVMFVTTG